MVKEPLGFVKVLQWVSVVWAIGGGKVQGEMVVMGSSKTEG